MTALVIRIEMEGDTTSDDPTEIAEYILGGDWIIGQGTMAAWWEDTDHGC